MGSGGIVVLLGLVGLAGYTTSAFVPFLAVLLIGGLASVDYLWRHPDAVDWSVADKLKESIERIDERYGIRRTKSRMIEYAEEHRSLLLGGAVVGLVVYVGIVLIAPGALVFLFGILLVGGFTAMDYAYGHREDFDGIEVVPQRRTEITINTTDGSTIFLTSDSADGIDRELNRQVFAPPFASARGVSFRTN
ncbi:hypothetical protein [Halorubrum sp. DTA98]|uniref:hypothetical protein n=1 Tax=Halorubrum sp. DTA98 TaxID=3402163 RepID=UPI003AB0E8DC